MKRAVIFPFDINEESDRPKLIVRVRCHDDNGHYRTQFIVFHWPICIEDIVDSVMLRTKADEIYFQRHMVIEVLTAEDLFNET